jgi:hypothetical protein
LEFLKISKELHTVLAARTHLAEGQWLEEQQNRDEDNNNNNNNNNN